MVKLKLLIVFAIVNFTTPSFAQKISLKIADGLILRNTEIIEVKHKGKDALKVKAIVNNKSAMVLLPNSDFADGTIEFEMAANRTPNSHPES
jgi:hypothetical protein